MILGIGVDIVQVDRMAAWLATPGLVERFFHPEELSALMSKGQARAESLAARFAAKEAFGKALGTGLRGLGLKNIRVLYGDGGRPCIRLEGLALAAFDRVGGKATHLSLSHERSHAVAMVVIEV